LPTADYACARGADCLPAGADCRLKSKIEHNTEDRTTTMMKNDAAARPPAAAECRASHCLCHQRYSIKKLNKLTFKGKQPPAFSSFSQTFADKADLIAFPRASSLQKSDKAG
jgi:hypothetical protein